MTDLPGYPDNIARGSDGLVWVSIASPTDPLVARLQAGPAWLARQVTRIPERLQPAPKRTVRAQAFDAEGRLVHDARPPGTEFHMVTGVREHDGRLWLGSLHEPAVAVVDLTALSEQITPEGSGSRGRPGYSRPLGHDQHGRCR